MEETYTMSLLYKGDIGAKLVIETENVSIPVSTTLTMRLEKPSLNTVEISIPGSIVNYTTGVITYTTISGDLNEAGEYKVQIHGSFVDTSDLVSDIDSFVVYDRLVVTPP
jgi:hypothetical protein